MIKQNYKTYSLKKLKNKFFVMTIIFLVFKHLRIVKKRSQIYNKLLNSKNDEFTLYGNNLKKLFNYLMHKW